MKIIVLFPFRKEERYPIRKRHRGNFYIYKN